jgi:hypothetical protein
MIQVHEDYLQFRGIYIITLVIIDVYYVAVYYVDVYYVDVYYVDIYYVDVYYVDIYYVAELKIIFMNLYHKFTINIFVMAMVYPIF